LDFNGRAFTGDIYGNSSAFSEPEYDIAQETNQTDELKIKQQIEVQKVANYSGYNMFNLLTLLNFEF